MIIKWKPLVVNLLISLGVGAASALFTMNNMKAVYADRSEEHTSELQSH